MKWRTSVLKKVEPTDGTKSDNGLCLERLHCGRCAADTSESPDGREQHVLNSLRLRSLPHPVTVARLWVCKDDQCELTPTSAPPLTHPAYSQHKRLSSSKENKGDTASSPPTVSDGSVWAREPSSSLRVNRTDHGSVVQ
eukprot:GHVU01176825.1.p1 GENE.GHVU01176825.1~~GHVU01176825.1.p1  ORF type:complete len:139 (+),score=10.75 GHVU01176825.1:299-715(+)